MEDNNVHTSVVIELANTKEESEGQNSYQIDIDDMSVPKDYVIDQIFCGENVTVYALFEVPEGDSRSTSKNYVRVNNSSNNSCDKTYDYKDAYKKVEKKINGYKQNSSPKSSEEYLKFFSDAKTKNKSLYCLKHPSGNYDLLTPDRKKSDLRVLYSKNFSLEESKSTKFKAISVGVNTDIVQCPKILEDVQKVLGVNVPHLKFREKMIDTSNYSSTLSSDLTEIETRQSFSSLTSAADSRVSNFFFVPFLMMEDDALSKYSKDDSTQKSLEKESGDLVLKVSLGINTDESEFESGKINTLDGYNDSSKTFCQCSSDQLLNRKFKLNEKRTLLAEIKTMKSKLDALIDKIESSSYESDEKNDDLMESDSKICIKMEETDLKKNPGGKIKNFDERPILLTWNYLNDEKSPKNPTEEVTNLQETEQIDDVPQNEQLLVLEIIKDNKQLESQKPAKIRWKSSECSKSEANLLSRTKHNVLKNTLSLNLKNVKSEILKNQKNLFLLEANFKRNIQKKNLKSNVKNSENVTHCELGDDSKRNLTERTNLINTPTEVKKEEPLNVSEGADMKKNYKEEEGDAKSDKPQLPFVVEIDKPQTPYIDPNMIASDDVISSKKSLNSSRKDSKTIDKTIDIEKKSCSDSEKPQQSDVNVRKIITTPPNSKKDFKGIKKTNNRYKVAEATTKVDIPFRRVLTSCRIPNRISGESKLHINKLIKSQIENNNNSSSNNNSNNNINIHNNNNNNNNKTPNVTKNDEKPTGKVDKMRRSSSQKIENRPPILEIVNESKEVDNKKSHVEAPSKKLCNLKTKVESGIVLESTGDSQSSVTSQKNNPPLSESESSSVVVKLLAKKPESMKDFCTEINEEFSNGQNDITPKNGANKSQIETDVNIENMEKSIVKSVWALTKVLLFEDGTKKLEVLEASLTPPGYSLNQSVKQ